MSTTDTNQQVAEVLAEALALMNNEGVHWHQGWLVAPGGRYCALGAIKETTGGVITLDGIPIHGRPPARRNVAMAFEAYSLYPPLTIAENMIRRRLRCDEKPSPRSQKCYQGTTKTPTAPTRGRC